MSETEKNSCSVVQSIANSSFEVNPPTVPNSPPKLSQRGRPRLNVNWPEGEFTFGNLNEKNVLSSSSLRKKMRAELQKGNLVKTGTLKVAFGRPQNIYKRA